MVGRARAGAPDAVPVAVAPLKPRRPLGVTALPPPVDWVEGRLAGRRPGSTLPEMVAASTVRRPGVTAPAPSPEAPKPPAWKVRALGAIASPRGR